MTEPIQGEALREALKAQQPVMRAGVDDQQSYMEQIEHLASLHFGAPRPSMSESLGAYALGSFAASRSREAVKPGWKTTEFWVSLFAMLGAAAPVLSLAVDGVAKLSALYPGWGLLGVAGVVLGGLYAMSKVAGDYARSRTASKTGRPFGMLAILFCLSMPTLARAEDTRAVLFAPPAGSPGALTVAPELPPLASYLSWGWAVGVDVGDEVRPSVDLTGHVGLFRLAGRVVSLGLGGSVVLGESARPGLSTSLAWSLPGLGDKVQPSVFAGGRWRPDVGWSFMAGFGFQLAGE